MAQSTTLILLPETAYPSGYYGSGANGASYPTGTVYNQGPPITVVGNAVPASAYYLSGRNLQTLSWTFDVVVATVSIQASLATDPQEGDWYDVYNITSTAEGVATVGYPVLGATVVTGGTGYASGNPVLFSQPDLVGGVQATGTVIADGAGSVAGVTMINVGSGYTSAPTVTFPQAVPSGNVVATGYANINTSAGSVFSVTVTDHGGGYTTPPRVVIAPPLTANATTATATAVLTQDPIANTSFVSSVTVTNSGTGYTTTPTVDIFPPQSMGTGYHNLIGNFVWLRAVVTDFTGGIIGSVKVTY